MIDYDHADLFLKDSVNKQMQIQFDGGTITNTELHSQQFELTESLCSENQLRFGACEASSIKFRISNVFTSLKGKWLTVSDVLDGHTAEPFLFGQFKVDSDVPTADRRCRDVVAYDRMHDILTADVITWYNTILPNEDSTVTMKQFRDSFFAYFGITQETVTLVNDSMIVEKTIDATELSGQTVITAICEINGCFGHIWRDGKFQYIHLKEMVEGLYPRDDLYPADDLFPADPLNAEPINANYYISAKYEDYTTAKINKLQIRQEEDDIGVVYGTGNNCYIVEDNFLVYGKSSEELQTIAANLYSVISRVWYRPAHVEAKGNPCLNVGDGIRVRSRYEIIYTYILQRTLKGIQALRDTYDAEGEQYQPEVVESVQRSIIQLKGKTNKLTRTLEETILEIADIEQGLSTRITQNTNAITLEAQRAVAEEAAMSAQIALNAQQILLKVSKNNIVSEINQTAETIKIQASKIDLVGLVNATELTSKFATIETLNATSASLQSLIADKASIASLNALNGVVQTLQTEKLSASEFTAENISAMNITVRGANITGTLTANKISAGSVTVSGQSRTMNWTAKEVVTGVSSITKSNGYVTGFELSTSWMYYLGSGGVNG